MTKKNVSQFIRINFSRRSETVSNSRSDSKVKRQPLKAGIMSITMKRLLELACFLYWIAGTESSYPAYFSLAAKLSYDEKRGPSSSEEFSTDLRIGPDKSRISDFTDPDTGLNPYLDLVEGPSGVRPKYYKYDRHSKRDNPAPSEKDRPAYDKLTMAEKNLSLNHAVDAESKDETSSPDRFQRVPENDKRSEGPEEFVEPEMDGNRNPAFVSVVEGESGGRRPFWTTPTRSKTTTILSKTTKISDTTPPEVIGTSEKTLEVKPTMEYLTIRPEERPTSVVEIPETRNNAIESRSDADGEKEDGASFREDDENRPDIATFLDTKSFVFSLALICGSVVFFAALLTGMFVYRRKRRRLPGVREKGGRFFFKTSAKNRIAAIGRQREERILQDDFRVTVC